MHFLHCQNFLANHVRNVPKTFFCQFTHSERPAKFLLCLIYCSHLCNTTAGIHSSCFLEFFMHRLHFACIWNSLPKVQTHLTFLSSSWITLSKILLRKKLTIGWLFRPIFYQTHTLYHNHSPHPIRDLLSTIMYWRSWSDHSFDKRVRSHLIILVFFM